jgi:CRP/FNR family transcriptional regulator, cyclic AMP receptor protein
MISPEVLRRFPFFFGFDDNQLKALAMIAEEYEVDANTTIFGEGEPAHKFYLLAEGSIDLFVKSEDQNNPAFRREFSAGEINPGDVFGINSILEPYKHGFTERAGQASKIIEFDGAALRALIEVDKSFAHRLFLQVAKSLMERLYSTRVQLGAAWA